MKTSEEKAKEQMKALGAQLAILLELAEIPSDQKEAWLEVLPDLSFEQVDALMKFLVSKIPEESVEEFEQFEDQMKEIQATFEHDVNAMEQDAMDQLAALEKKIEANE